MSRKPTWRALLCGFAVGVATGCAAKAPVRSFPDLQERLERGTTVYVIDDTGAETRGRLVDVAASALTVAVDGVPRRMEQDSVRQVQTYGDTLWNGLFIGMVTAVPGMLIADPTYDPCPTNPQLQCANSRVGQRVLGVGIMGLIGAGVDALIRGRHQVYLAPNGTAASTSARARVVPRVGPSSAAIFVTLRVP